MLSWLKRTNNYFDLPLPLRRYVLSVSVVGPALAAALLLISANMPLTRDTWSLVIVLFVLAGVAERFPLHLTHKTNLNVATAVYVAMLLLLPPLSVGALAMIAAGGAQLVRLRASPGMGLAEPMFNLGQTALYTGFAGLAMTVVDSSSAPSLTYGSVSLSALVIAGTSLHIGNSLLVAGAAGLSQEVSPLRIWRQSLLLDIKPHIGMCLIGACAAELGAESALLIPTLFVPGVLVHKAVGESVRLRENMHKALASLVDIVELRDPYTAGHSRRVAVMARAIALELGLTAEEADTIESAGQVHDIGKVGVSPAVLMKPGGLTDAEWAEMKRHPVFGAEVIGQFDAYQDGAPLVRWHHEAWDGSGYPDGIAGDRIPIGARILAVADTFDALTSDRPYRNGMPLERARAILAAGAGKQWDAEIVRSLFALLDLSPDELPTFLRQAPAGEGSPSQAANSSAVA